MLESLAALPGGLEPRGEGENGENQIQMRAAAFCKVGTSFVEPSRFISSLPTIEPRLGPVKVWEPLA